MEQCTLCLVGKILLTCGMMIFFGLFLVHYIRLFKKMRVAMKACDEDYPALVQKVFKHSAVVVCTLFAIIWVLNVFLSPGGG